MIARKPNKKRQTPAVVAPLLLLLCLGGLPVAGCDMAPAPPSSPDPEPGSFRIPLLREAHAAYSGSRTPGVRWATVADALPEFLLEAGIGAEDSAEFVEHFREGEHVAVVVWLGERPTGGYGVEFLGATSAPPGTITLRVAESSPPDDAMVTMALTAPVAAFLLPWSGETQVEVVWQTTADR